MSKLEELKATAAKLQQQIYDLEIKKWEPKGGRFTITNASWVSNSPALKGSHAVAGFGAGYDNREAAEKARDIMLIHNRLLAYVDEFGGDWVADWSLVSQNKYCITYDKLQLQWEVDCNYRTCFLGAVYMSEECAKGLVAKLESGEVVLCKITNF
tara:strand:+ start:205 stop:669 length:465 start_codon:yes stop_codon:yes gene_type:complete